MIRVLVVDDSRLVREVLRSMIERDPEIRVAVEAANGAEAVERTLKSKPDVILMDIQMPVMDGIEAVRRIMESQPTPVIVLSATIHPGEIRSTFAALRAGALDALAKPRGVVVPENYASISDELITRIKFYARVGKTKSWHSGRGEETDAGLKVPSRSSKIVAIGTSTGGPRTLPLVLAPLPKDFPCPILVVQHMGHGFMQGFAEWLSREIQLPVKLVEEAMRLEPGKVYMPPDGMHMEVARGAAVLREGPPVNGSIPSVDVLFNSVAREYGERAVGVILTGMGRDGAEGALAIKNAGGTVIAQDEETSVIFGMPRATIELGAASRVEPLRKIPSAIAACVTIPDLTDSAAADFQAAKSDLHEILVVDDSPTMRAMVADVLTDQGYRVRQAENGRMALDEVARQRPDLVLLDVMMPEMDGYAVCKRLRDDREYIPVLMITAKGDPGDLVRGIESGADDYITKPFEDMELAARVKSLLRIRTLQKRLYKQNSELEAKNRELERLAQALDRANKELTLLSVTDGLTRAYNHRHFQERLRSEFSRAERYHTLLSCLLLDLDHFKKVNDSYGHPAGDMVLVRLVELIHESVRSEDLVARYGGEEFVALLPETGGGRALNLANRIRERVEREDFTLPDGRTIKVTASIGVSHYEPGGKIRTPDQLLSAADDALYSAKSSGRNLVQLAK